MSNRVLARRWICRRCGVATGRLDSRKIPFPESWERDAEGDFCLACQRGRAADAAQAALSDDSNTASRAKARRDGLIEFEVRRTPELTDSTIAKACHTSATVVAAARTRLRMGAGPPSGSDREWASAAQRRAGGQRA